MNWDGCPGCNVDNLLEEFNRINGILAQLLEEKEAENAGLCHLIEGGVYPVISPSCSDLPSNLPSASPLSPEKELCGLFPKSEILGKKIAKLENKIASLELEPEKKKYDRKLSVLRDKLQDKKDELSKVHERIVELTADKKN